MKGGWGCARILDKLNYDTIKNNPKIIMGFSDITSLLLAITSKTGLVTFHGPVGNSGWNDFTIDYVKRVFEAHDGTIDPCRGVEGACFLIKLPSSRKE